MNDGTQVAYPRSEGHKVEVRRDEGIIKLDDSLGSYISEF